jgi:hypothetical protein
MRAANNRLHDIPAPREIRRGGVAILSAQPTTPLASVSLAPELATKLKP